MSVNSPSKTINSGLVLSLDAGNIKSYVGSGNAWNDLSKSGNNATLQNTPTFSNSNGGILTFDGINEYASTSFDLSWNNTNSVTISMFIKPQSLSSYFPFIGKGPSNWEWELIQNTTSLQFVYWNTAGAHTNGPISVVSNFFTDTTNFVHLTLVWNHVDNKHYFYKNSTLVHTETWTDASINQNRTDTINIGGNLYQWGTNGSYWPGTIGSITTYNRALNGNEIVKNYNTNRRRFGLK